MTLGVGVLAAALLLWGWHNDLLLVSAPLAVVLELPRWIPWRWDLSDKDFQRIADASTIGFVLLAVYQFDASGASGIYGILLWLPAAMFPLTMAQIYSTRARIDYTALFWSVRAAVGRGNIPDPGGVDIRLSYLVACAVSTSGGDAHPHLLLPSVAALLVWILWCNRPRRYPLTLWVATAVGALGLCLALQAGTLKLRRVIEPLAMAFLEDRIAARGDPYRAYTAIGHIGKLKLSDRIVLRVKPDPGSDPPSLLHQASYQSFSRNMWVSGRSRFNELRSSAEGTAWHIAEDPVRTSAVSIGAYLPNGKGLLTVPGGTRRVSDLPVDGVYRNSLGALKVLRGPEVVNFRAHYTPHAFVESAPDAADLAVPRELRKLFHGLVARLGIDAARDRESLEIVRRFFSRGFSYSLNLRPGRKEATPLADFLLERRSGHCEYYATSTVLLLRAAGIPARYATGYSVQEYSELEDRYVVRRRHAHSWALAWVGGRWRDVDTTPVVWGALESTDASWWQPAYDLGSWLAFLFAEWRWEETDDEADVWMLWLVLPLALVLVWRMARRQRVRRAAAGRESPGGERARQGADSAFYAIERRLLAAGHARREGESARAWLRRLHEAGAAPDVDELLREVLPLHYRYRFHPLGLDAAGDRELAARARSWLARHPAKPG